MIWVIVAPISWDTGGSSMPSRGSSSPMISGTLLRTYTSFSASRSTIGLSSRTVGEKGVGVFVNRSCHALTPLHRRGGAIPPTGAIIDRLAATAPVGPGTAPASAGLLVVRQLV
ncbi:hypothetical protein [Accumulibacter sp.]|uniref:hypothetical protein n=1 Tax=Accumulibacter sp. TaxID=2053492 RepID=UPI0025D66C7E|nr:hypothetical protein [Accumulibacter sp.]MCM8596492.1 hypothetical protein [Accumulibacter sp.]MCM8627336.1 hypothetical protein [Accumulibacter sp.]MDS4050640.1 hypothetical protein [Accumulibacter sp.]